MEVTHRSELSAAERRQTGRRLRADPADPRAHAGDTFRFLGFVRIVRIVGIGIEFRRWQFIGLVRVFGFVGIIGIIGIIGLLSYA